MKVTISVLACCCFLLVVAQDVAPQPDAEGCAAADGTVYPFGQSFIDENGCDTCFCTDDGSIHCTEQECPTTRERCPMPREDSFGTCEVTCDATAVQPCSQEGQTCCPGINGCAHACVDPVVPCATPDGREVEPGETFTSSDGCNTCTCQEDGRVLCTLIACINPCFLPQPEQGECTVVLPRYFYDQSAEICRRYSGGCELGSSDLLNSFATAGDCYDSCDPDSVCNADIYPPDFIPSCNVLARRWTFNSTTGQCTEFQYHPCGERIEGFNVFLDMESCQRRCVRRTDMNQCPDGVDRFSCFADPCEVNTCPNFPNATCRRNFCGGCFAYYFDAEGNNVTEQCEEGTETCEDGTPIVQCFRDPCDGTSCPEFPEAECVSNFCGGCNFNYIDANGVDVTRQCQRSLPVPIRQPVCPLVDSSLTTICLASCTTDSDCTGDQICCTSSCNRACKDPVFIPYYAIPPVCPVPTVEDFFSICRIDEESCTANSQCEDTELCCDDGRCGRTCTEAINSRFPCFEVLERIRLSLGSSAPPPGFYLPTCREDGLFEPVQCSNSTGLCWCVDVRSGQAVSSYSPRGTRPQCSGCTYDGEVYDFGESFSVDDGCNSCSCLDTGTVICTLRACLDPCSLAPEVGPCDAAQPAFYFDQESESCRSFTYGGCGGNANKFKTVGDCLRRCDEDNVCLLPKDSGPCEAAFPSFFFNQRTGQCERFLYGGCEGNENRFETLRECLQQCSPDTIDDIICPAVECVAPICPPGSELVIDIRHCCPYCAPTGVECDEDEFRCVDGECISEDLVCDGLKDCSDGADEIACEDVCDFRCGDKTCLRDSQVCDRIIDCRDGADIRNCTREFTNVYYLRRSDIPAVCPDASDLIGICVSECSANADCEDGEVCCSNGCGQTCMEGIQTGPLCGRIQDLALPEFQPECTDDGRFAPVQCFDGFCWCVDVVSGQPASDGVPEAEELACGGCRRPNGEGELSVGDSTSSDDGCNTCTCVGPDQIVCSLRPCEDASCKFQDRIIESGTSVSDECNTCFCRAGSLNCERKECNRAMTGAVRQFIRATLPFGGDFGAIRDRLDDFKREVMRSFLAKYAAALGFVQDQIRDIEVREGSVILIVTFEEANTTTDGANVTVLIGQVQQDYESGTLVIRYEDQILQPSGEFQSDLSDGDDDDDSGGLLASHIAIIVVATVAVMAVLIVIAIAVAVIVRSLKKKTNDDNDEVDANKTSSEPNEYELPVTMQSEKENLKENFA